MKMGAYINLGNAGFKRIRNSEYFDKSGLISVVNKTLVTENSFSCVTRCRRFGKSVAAKMLCAYYDHSVDSRALFTDLEIADTLSQSKYLLRATLEGDSETVAQIIDTAHDENTSILSYNNENSMVCVLSIAFIYAKNDYVMHREFASGKGCADIVLIPRKNVDSPALVIELKYNKDIDSGIDQIMRRNYPAKVAEYADRLLLVAINYDKATKTHTCDIQKIENREHLALI